MTAPIDMPGVEEAPKGRAAPQLRAPFPWGTGASHVALT